MTPPFLVPLLWLVQAAGPPADRCGTPGATPSAFAVVERAAGSDTLATITICLIADASRMKIAGYHGELSFAPSSRVVKVDRPTGGTRIENTTVAGRVSFAGVAAEGLTSGPVLALTLARRSASDDARIRLTMIDVTDMNGRSIGPQIRVDSLPRINRP